MHLEEGFSRYFIALVPGGDLYGEVMAMKEHMAKKYRSKAGLRSPPHITLHMPFIYKEKNEDRLVKKLSVLSQEKQIMTALSGFGAFPPRVIYIRVELNNDLYDLWKKVVTVTRRDLGLDNADYKSLGFIPHMTLAFRDLKKDLFHKAWAEYSVKEFEREFPVREIALLKQGEQGWNVLKSYPLNP
ncbi:MAG: 2'-5' RNA ligase family protein [Cyclobacteriaceae bacterium]|nr:2'-5' RNA ligase family protein [Cyclobacteriaceae bacterium]